VQSESVYINEISTDTSWARNCDFPNMQGSTLTTVLPQSPDNINTDVIFMIWNGMMWNGVTIGRDSWLAGQFTIL